MGACSFIKCAESTSAREAFELLTEKSRYYHGHDSYNGTISTCSMGRQKKSFPVYTAENEAIARDFIESEDYGEKYVAHYIDMGVKHYVITTVKPKSHKDTSVYKKMFAICNDKGEIVRPISSNTFLQKKPAQERALKLIAEGTTDIEIRHIPVHQGGNSLVASFDIVQKTVTKKPKKLAKGQSIKEIHKFCFYGWAAE